MMKRLLLLTALVAVGITSGVAQVTSPASGVQYQILNDLGLAMTRLNNKCQMANPDTKDKNQAWVFEPGTDAGYYYMKTVGTESYLYLGTADTWNMEFGTSLPTDVTKGEFTLEALTGENVAFKLKCNDKHLGSGGTLGSWVYGDNAVENHGAWVLKAIPMGTDALNALVVEVQKYESDNLGSYPGLAGELEDAILEYGTPANTDSATVKACQDSINATLDRVKQGLSDAQTLQYFITTCDQLLSTTSYPGLAAFKQSYAQATGVSNNKDATSSDYALAVTAIKAAIKTYKLSQTATADSPSDYTFLVQHPWFCNDENTPASNSSADIAAANLSGNVVNGGGWVNGSTATGGDVHPSYGKSRTCYNAWNSNYSGFLDVHQNLTDLPNGLYSISCDAITPDGCINDQHAYAQSTVQTSVSPYLANSKWVDDDASCVWETLSTAENGKVYVNDGKLTIGFRGSRDAGKGDGSNGWFLVTNFKLTYYGAVDETMMKTMLDAKIAECQAQCDTMLFKGDKATYQKAIDAAKSATGIEGMTAAFMALNNDTQPAASIAAQNAVLGSAYKNIADSLAAGVYTDGTLRTIMQSAYNNATSLIQAEGQTCACADSVVNSMNAYLYAYAAEYAKALQAIGSLTQVSSRDAVRTAISSQIVALKSDMLGRDAIEDIVAQIETALRNAAANDILAVGGTDYTAIIVNPTCESTSRTVNPKGWDISLKHSSNGWSNDTWQQYDGSAHGSYLNAWNSSAKCLLFNVHQTISNLPNGTYTLKAMCRTSGNVGSEGTYLYTIADNDSVSGVQLAMVKREQCNITKATMGQFVAFDGSDSLLYVTDTYGSIWEAAATATDYGTNGSDIDMAVYSANNCAGYGWHYVEVPAVVKNHCLTIGFTTDSTFTLGRKDIEGNACVPFSGWWVSADNFSLTMTAQGDNADWTPVTSVASPRGGANGLHVTVAGGRIVANEACKVFNMNGQLMNGRSVLPRGCYIVKGQGSAIKVAVE